MSRGLQEPHRRRAGAVDLMDLRHLTCLSVLQLMRMRAGTMLPSGARVLCSMHCIELEPLVADKLPQLEELHLSGYYAGEVATQRLLKSLTNLRGCPKFRGLRLGLRSVSQEIEPLVQLARLCTALKQVPLVGLSMSVGCSMSERIVSSLGSLTQLTSLGLDSKGWMRPVVKQLVATLQQATVLQNLWLQDHLHGDSEPGVLAGCADWQLVCEAVVALHSLRSVCIRGCCLRDAAARLASATHLTHLELRWCGLSDASKAALADGLQDLVPEHLRIE